MELKERIDMTQIGVAGCFAKLDAMEAVLKVLIANHPNPAATLAHWLALVPNLVDRSEDLGVPALPYAETHRKCLANWSATFRAVGEIPPNS